MVGPKKRPQYVRRTEHLTVESSLAVVSNRIDRHELLRALRAAGTVDSDAELVGLTHRPIGVGHTSDTLLIDLTWAAPGSGPGRLVAKVPSTDAQSASTAASLGLYQREARFYAELAPHTTVSTPRFLGVMHYDGDPSGVLLEDLSALSPGDQFTDTPAPLLRRMRAQLAALQAPFWNDGSVAELSWLHRRLGVPIPGIVDRMQRSWAVTRGYLAAGFDAKESALIDRFVAGAGEWAESIGGPLSLTHHDFRVDNMLLADSGGDRHNRGDETLVVLDWQTVGWGAPMFDVAYLLGTSVDPESRRRLEHDEVARHVDDLAALGVQWSAADAWQAYRQVSFAVLLMLVPPTGSVKRTERGDAMYRRLLRHGARMALDLGAEEFLS